MAGDPPEVLPIFNFRGSAAQGFVARMKVISFHVFFK
jgi:hypothetical protein